MRAVSAVRHMQKTEFTSETGASFSPSNTEDLVHLLHCRCLSVPLKGFTWLSSDGSWGLDLRSKESFSESQLASSDCCNALGCSAALGYCSCILAEKWSEFYSNFCQLLGKCGSPIGFEHACKAFLLLHLERRRNAFFFWTSPPYNLPVYLFPSLAMNLNTIGSFSWQREASEGTKRGWTLHLSLQPCCSQCKWWRGALSLQEGTASPRVAGKVLSL